MSTYRISKDDILTKTNGGLDIFEFYIKGEDLQAMARTRKKFKLREEATPSCTIKQTTDGNYILADFGQDGKWRNGIAFAQWMENLEFGEAIKLLAVRHGVGSAEQVDSMYQAKVSSENAKPDQPDKAWYFKYAEAIPESHLRILFSKSVFAFFQGRDDVKKLSNEKERNEAVLKQLRDVCTKQHWHALESYTIIKDRKAITFEAAEYYPIFCIEETFDKNGKEVSFKKIYQPKSKDKGKRFFYHGDFDPQFLHGLSQVQQLFDEEQQNADEDELNRDGIKKLESIFYGTGGSDCLNAAALGLPVVYGSSEYFKLSKKLLKSLTNMADKVLTCPDLDATGLKQNHELCMNPDSDIYLDIYVMDLPEKLKKNKDQYGRPCKDLRDFLNHFSAKEFFNLVKTAKPYRFWDRQLKIDQKSEKPIIKFGKPVYEYRLSNERILHFLQRCGFCINEEIEGIKEYIHIDGYIVRAVDPSSIKTFLIEFLRSRYLSEELINLVHKSPALNESSFTSLENKHIEFKDYEKDCQYFFFLNDVWKVDKSGIEVLPRMKVVRKVWEKKIIKHSPRKSKPMFRVFVNADGHLDIEIFDQSDMFFRFLIQTSRIHWRAELEENLAHLGEDERNAYKEANKFNIAGPNLTEDQRREQKLHLINKMYALGYMLHRYKDPSNPWALFAMDGKVSDDGLSHGGTGKSIFSKAITHFRTTVNFDGKDEKLFQNSHAFDRINSRTDYLLFDDAGKTFQFDRLFSIITGTLIVNKKAKDSFEIDGERSPKIAISTNFTPSNIEQSTIRRLLFAEFSDYYHIMMEGEYNETRQPSDEFGKNLFTEFNAEEWNSTINFLMQCCSMYFNFGKIEPPSGNILTRNLIAAMGMTFYNWADVYFAEDSGRLNKTIPIIIAKEDYMREVGIKTMATQGLMFRLKYYAQLRNLILNPKDILPKNGRFTKNRTVFAYDTRHHKWVKTDRKKTQEVFYLQVPGTDINDVMYDPSEDHLEQLNKDEGFPPLPPEQQNLEDF